ncbi:hypothetical protein SCHPADRAFT_944915 [Schizopora paradoxa]|uniref:Uncharacterized protein n=1 Tax=Schizopora paradoxa TaxID=27342 RepID=A0A0H2R7J4_9AGAM|nr:hypothetical protein SCHPADRAFT_944915 [Schizopora paradoxa]
MSGVCNSTIACNSTTPTNPTCLSRTESIGLSFFVEAGILSASALAILVGLIIRNVYRYKKHAKAYKWRLVDQPADVYVLSLFVADVLQSIGSAMSARWVHTGVVEPGHFCTAQGVIQQVGETSVGLATMIIAIHTFLSVWMRVQHRVRTALIVATIPWLFMALFVGIAARKHKDYDEPSPFWCWVGPNYKPERIFGEYLWLWLTIFVSMAVYIPLILWNQGLIAIDEKHWWKVSWYRKSPADADEKRERPVGSSLKLLAYPVAYSIVVLPLSVVRWITFDEKPCESKVPEAATFAVVFLHGCFGFVNVVLLLTTRQTLLLFDDPRNPRQVRLRRAAGGALVDWDDDEAQVGGDSRLSRRSSQRSRRAISLDSSRDALGIMLERRTTAGRSNDLSVSVLHPTPSLNLRQLGSSDDNELRSRSSRGDGEISASEAELQRHRRGSIRSSTHWHSKADSAGSAHSFGGAGVDINSPRSADEYSDEEIAMRMALVTSSV